MRRRYNGRITTGQALAGINCCLQNAQELLEESRILLKAGRPARALGLALIAWEEMGKVPMLAGVPRYNADPSEWKKGFWQRFRDHREKLVMHHMATTDLVSGPSRKEPLSEMHADWGEISALRELMLYADFDGQEFRMPSRLPEINILAERVVASLECGLDVHRTLMKDMTPARLEEVANATLRLLEMAWESVSARSPAISREEFLAGVVSVLKEAVSDARAEAKERT